MGAGYRERHQWGGGCQRACKQLWSDWVILKGSDWIALKWKCFSRRFRWLTVNEKWTPILRELRWWCFTSLVITYGFVASERAPLKRKPWCPHICVVVHFKYFELNFYLRWLRYKMWWMTFELGLIEFFPSLKKGSKSGVARQNLKVNWIDLELKIFNCRLCGDAVNRASMEWLDGKRLRSRPLLDVQLCPDVTLAWCIVQMTQGPRIPSPSLGFSTESDGEIQK